MAKETKLVLKGMYEKVINGKTYYATCVNVMKEGSRLFGTLSIYGYSPLLVEQGSDELNTWKRKLFRGLNAVDMGDIIDQVGHAVESGAEVAVDVINAVDKVQDAAEVLKKSKK